MPPRSPRRLHLLRWSLAPAALLALTLPLWRGAREVELATRDTSYLEDEGTGRRLAALHLQLTAERADTARLAITVSALGPEVDPIPSFEGIHGANHITARELTELLAQQRLRVVTLPAGGSTKRFGTITHGPRGHVPARRLRRDGSLDFAAASFEDYILSAVASSPALGPGDHEVYLEAHGVPRLRVDVHIGAGSPPSGVIRAVHSLSGHAVGRPRMARAPDRPAHRPRVRRAAVGALDALAIANTPQQTVAPAPQGVDPTRWARFDQHSKWVVYRQSMTSGRATPEQWVAFLDSRDDLATLEQMAIYEGFQQVFNRGKPGEVLYRRDANTWMRVALWNLGQSDSHGAQMAEKPLEQNPRRFLGWAKKFKEVAQLGGKQLIAKLSAQHGPDDPGDQLRPLDPQVVILPYLDAPNELPELRPGARYEPRTRYLHEVLRAIGAIPIAAVFDPPYRGKLLRLTRHPNARVRHRAILAFSRFPAAKVPHRELLALVDDSSAPAEDRGLAMLAATYSTHPDVYLRIHEVLSEPKHPGLAAVLSRVGALGDAWTEDVLGRLDPGALDPGPQELLASAKLAVSKKVRAVAAKRLDVGHRMRLVLHAERSGSRCAEDLRRFTEARLRDRVDTPAVRAELKKIADAPGSVPVDPRDRAALAAWATRLLDARR
ncbi:MAG: hypothetical protein H6837_21220 [Planctomycetes bacterium]|nr:hypothetical protein [Planctomycetota bacterium]